MTDFTLREVSDDELGAAFARFDAEGYAVLPGVLDAHGCDVLRGRADDLMLGRVTYPGMFFQIDTDSGRYEDLAFGTGWVGPSTNYRKIEKLERDPLFLAYLRSPLFRRITRARIGEAVTLYRAVLMGKAARGGTVLPFHQDAGKFWGVDRDPQLQIWTALDDAPVEAGCMEIVPGSHARGLATPLGGLVPENLVSDRDADARAVAIPARAGDVVVLHNLAWHRSGVNATAHPRRAVTVCYMDAATRCLRKKRAPREFFRVF